MEIIETTQYTGCRVYREVDGETQCPYCLERSNIITMYNNYNRMNEVCTDES